MATNFFLPNACDLETVLLLKASWVIFEMNLSSPTPI
jgi:hypothetical protein